MSRIGFDTNSKARTVNCANCAKRCSAKYAPRTLDGKRVCDNNRCKDEYEAKKMGLEK